MNVPNIISIGRLLSVPVNVWLILLGEWRFAFLLFSLAGLSDAVDGMIAKHFNARTRLGLYLDPIADKVLLVSIFVVLGIQELLPLWLVVLVVSRDFLIVGGLLLLHMLDLTAEPRPRWSSKLNTVMQILTATLVLAGMAFELELHRAVYLATFMLTGVTTAVSGADYLLEWGRRIGALDRTEQR